MNQCRPWSSIDNEIVKVRYSDDWESNKRLAKELNRSYQALKARARVVGVAKVRKNGWKPYELDMLEDMTGRYNNWTIANKLHRSINAVVKMQSYIGVRSTMKEDWYTVTEAQSILGVGYTQMMHWIDNNKLIATRHNDAGKCGTWHISKVDLKTFIRRYPLELNGRNVDIVQLVEILAGIDYNMNKKDRVIGDK